MKFIEIKSIKTAQGIPGQTPKACWPNDSAWVVVGR